MTTIATILAAIGLSISSTNEYRFVKLDDSVIQTNSFCGSALVTSESGDTIIRAEDAAFLTEAIYERYNYYKTILPKNALFNKSIANNLKEAVQNKLHPTFDAGTSLAYLSSKFHKSGLVVINEINHFTLPEIVSSVFTSNSIPSLVKTNDFVTGRQIVELDVRKIFNQIDQLKYLCTDGCSYNSSIYNGTHLSTGHDDSYPRYYDPESLSFEWTQAHDDNDTYSITNDISYLHTWSANKFLVCGVGWDCELTSPEGPFVNYYDDYYTPVNVPARIPVRIPAYATNIVDGVEYSALSVLVYIFRMEDHSVGGDSKLATLAMVDDADISGTIAVVSMPNIVQIKNSALSALGETESSGSEAAQNLPTPNPPEKPKRREDSVVRSSNYTNKQELYVKLVTIYIVIEPKFHARTIE